MIANAVNVDDARVQRAPAASLKDDSDLGQRLVTIPGTVPELADLPAGCAFAGRCAYVVPACHHTTPTATDLGQGHAVRCIRLEAVAASTSLEGHTP